MDMNTACILVLMLCSIAQYWLQPSIDDIAENWVQNASAARPRYLV